MPAQLFLNHSSKKLTQITAAIESCLGKLDETQIWHHSSDAQNSIGNLILHLSGNVRQWIGWSVGGQPDIRNRPLEFSADSRIPKPNLLALLQTTIDDAVNTLETLPPSRLTETVQTQDGERSILEVIYQVVGHFQQHAGQIFFATKLLTGDDLKFYAEPKKSS